VAGNWVDPPKRERKRAINYAEHGHKGSSKGGDKSGSAKNPKIPAMPDYQFFNVARITEVR
jgi:hypothetical protein